MQEDKEAVQIQSSYKFKKKEGEKIKKSD